MARKLTSVQLPPVENVDELRSKLQEELNRIIGVLNSETLRQDLNAGEHRIRNLRPGVELSDAVTVSQLEDTVQDARTKILNVFEQEISGTALSILFVDITLTGAHSLIPPSVDVDTILVFTFTQDGTGGHAVTWPAGFARQYHVGQDPDRSSVFWFRVQSGPTYALLAPAILNREN